MANCSLAGKDWRRNGGVAADLPDWKLQALVDSVHSTEALGMSTGRPPMQPFLPGGSRNGRRLQRIQPRSRQPALHARAVRNGKDFGSELQRLFAAVVLADHRLLGHGQEFRHRFCIVDCATAGQLDEVINAVHEQCCSTETCGRCTWEI